MMLSNECLRNKNIARNWSEPVREPWEQPVKSVNIRSAERSLTEQKTVWKVKNARNGVKKRYGSIKNMCLISLTGLSVMSTLFKFDMRIQMILYLAAIAVLFIANPFDSLGRFISTPCRVMLSASSASLVLLGCRPGLDTFFLATAIICITYLLIKYMNGSWLAAENWAMTEAVQKSVRYDPDGLAEKSWQAQGCRETKTGMYEMGMSVDDDTVALQKGAYTIGYVSALKKNQQVDAMNEKLQKAQIECTEAERRFRRLEAEHESLQNDYDQLQAYQNEVASQDAYWKGLYQKEKKENMQLNQANEELVQALSLQEESQEEVNKVVQLKLLQSNDNMTRDEKLAYARHTLGYSYAKAAAYAGCSKTTAQNVLKASSQ